MLGGRGRDGAGKEEGRDSGLTSKGPVVVGGGEEEEEEHATAASLSFPAKREGWECSIVNVKSERDTWMAWHDRLIAANLKLMATIGLLARDSDRWQTKCMASAKRVLEVANEHDGPAREVDVGMLTLADVQGSTKPAQPSARGVHVVAEQERGTRGNGGGARDGGCVPAAEGMGDRGSKGGGGIRGEGQPAGGERRVGANFIR